MKVSGKEKLFEARVSQFPMNSLSDSIRKVRSETILCFWKFLVSKHFVHKRGYYVFFSSNHSTENFL